MFCNLEWVNMLAVHTICPDQLGTKWQDAAKWKLQSFIQYNQNKKITIRMVSLYYILADFNDIFMKSQYHIWHIESWWLRLVPWSSFTSLDRGTQKNNLLLKQYHQACNHLIMLIKMFLFIIFMFAEKLENMLLNLWIPLIFKASFSACCMSLFINPFPSFTTATSALANNMNPDQTAPLEQSDQGS